MNPIEKQFPLLDQFFGGYFHQDWMDEYENEDEIIKTYVHDVKSEKMHRLLQELDQLISLGLSEDELDRVMYEEMDCSYDPEADWKTMTNWLHWVRDTMAKYAAEKSAEEKKTHG